MSTTRVLALAFVLAACHREPPGPPPAQRLAAGVNLPESLGNAAPAVPHVRVVVGPSGIDVDTEALWASWPAEARESFAAAQDAARRADLPFARRGVVKLANFVAAGEAGPAELPGLRSALEEAFELERRFRVHAKLPAAKSSVVVATDAKAPYGLLAGVVRSAGKAASHGLDLAFLARKGTAAEPVAVPVFVPSFEEAARVAPVMKTLGSAGALDGALVREEQPKPPPRLWEPEAKREPQHPGNTTVSREDAEPIVAIAFDGKECAVLANGGLEKVPDCAGVPARLAALKPALGERPPRGPDGSCAAATCREGVVTVVPGSAVEAQAVVRMLETVLADRGLFTRAMLGAMAE